MVADSSDNSTSNNKASSRRQPRQRSKGFSNQVSISGVTTSAPTPSPDHHVNQSQPNLSQDPAPLKHRLVVPIVALIAVIKIAAKTTNFKTSIARLKGFLDPTNCRSRNPATIASSVLPMEIPIAVASETS